MAANPFGAHQAVREMAGRTRPVQVRPVRLERACPDPIVMRSGHALFSNENCGTCRSPLRVAFRTISEDNVWVQAELVWSPKAEDPAVTRFVVFMHDEARSRGVV